jgi:hypothetical protein
MVNTRLFRTILFTGTIALATSLNAQSPCGAADMKGDWATQPVGILVATPPGAPPAGPFAATGLLHFDGKSRFAGTASSSFNGVIFFPFEATGTYTVTADCFVSVFEETLGIIFEGYLTKDKSQVVFVQPQPFTVTTNVLRRLQLPPCDVGNSRENWAIQASGRNITTGQAFAQNGRLQFDGAGKFVGTTTTSNGGVIVQQNVFGVYNLNRDCTLTIAMTDQSAHTSHIFGAFYGDGSEFYLIYQDPGLVITGVGKKAVATRNAGN